MCASHVRCTGAFCDVCIYVASENSLMFMNARSYFLDPTHNIEPLRDSVHAVHPRTRARCLVRCSLLASHPHHRPLSFSQIQKKLKRKCVVPATYDKCELPAP